MKNFMRMMVVLLLFGMTACQHSSSVSKMPGTDDEAVHQKQPIDEASNFLPPDKYGDFAAQWGEVRKFDGQGLPRSADKVVAQILALAQKGENSPEIIKSMIYQMKYEMQIGEVEVAQTLGKIGKEIEKAPFPTKQVLHSLYAQLLYTYFLQNRHVFYNRTKTAGAPSADIATWDVRTLLNAIQKHYLLSLHSPVNLQEIKIDLFDAILQKGTKSRLIRPTLYDFLAHRAVTFFTHDQNQLTQPSFVFEIDDKKYFAPAQKFATEKIEARESDSMSFNALLILQKLTQFHLKDSSPDALVDVELARLAFVHRKTILENGDTLYFGALKKLESNYKSDVSTPMIAYTIAQWYVTNGGVWNSEVVDKTAYWSLKTAHDLCVETAKNYPKSEGGGLCRVLTNRLLQKNLSLNSEKTHASGAPFLANVTYKGIDKLYFRVLKYLPKHKKIIEDDRINYRDKYKKLLAYKQEKEWSVTLPDDGDLRQHVVAAKMPALEIGRYIVFAATSPSFTFDKEAVSWMFVDISNISFSHVNGENGTEVVVLDRSSGVPIANARIKIIQQKYNYRRSRYRMKVVARKKTDKNGRVSIKSLKHHRLQIEITKGKDTLKSNFRSFRHAMNDKDQNIAYFFTDRAIYRPGQTVHFKGIMLKKNRNRQPSIRPGVSTTVEFLDTNYQKITELRLKSNEYGSFSGTFIAPTGVLNGNMTIKNRFGSRSVSVEEYKRPKFETKFKPVKDNFKIGDKVTVTGSATSYSGAPLTDAKVVFSIVRRTWFPFNWWSWWYRVYNNRSVVIKNGEVKIDKKGEYAITFEALPDKTVPAAQKPSFSYSVQATVTDINGETHVTTTSVTVGYTALALSVDVPQRIDSQKEFSFNMNTSNLNGEFEAAQGSVEIWRISEPERLLKPRKLAKSDRFIMEKEEFIKLFPHSIYRDENELKQRKKAERTLSVPFDTKKEKKVAVGDISSWKPGDYQMDVRTKDRFGTDIYYRRVFTVYALKPGVENRKKYSDVEMVKRTVEPGESAHVFAGSGARNVYVYLDVVRRGKIVEKQIVTLDQSTKIISIPIKESDRGGVSYRWMFQKDGRLFSGFGVITVPWSNKLLKTEFLTFRDKLQPGEKEEWRIKITGPQGEKVSAEMVASLYDESLDTFRANSFSLNPFPYYGMARRWLSNEANNLTFSQLINDHWNTYVSYSPHYYDALNLFGLNFYRWNSYRRRSSRGRGGLIMESSAAPMKMKKSLSRSGNGMGVGAITIDAAESESLADEEDTDRREKKAEMPPVVARNSMQAADKTAAHKEKAVHIRKNLQETAFFYPHLKTNKEGEIVVSFTIPEALTRWKMIGLAHTKDLKRATLLNHLITQKELMVTPNVPRFLREMDTVVLSTKISNLTDKELAGKAELLLFNALNGKPIDAELKNVNSAQEFSVDAKGNSSVSWKLAIPEGIQAVTWRIIAKGGAHSDGEESTIPVLSNRMLVTESLPLPVNGNEKKEFLFKKLVDSKDSKTLSHHRLTLEFTSNPVWYAVQALPYLMEYPYECAEQIFSRYYANSLATHIVNSSPKIKKVFKQWEGTDALLSNLQKNQEFKSLLLEETPWVFEAESEEQQKKRIALLFDLNKMQRELKISHKKLKQMQGFNGGWPWFKGLPESRYISQHIVSGLGRLSFLVTKKEAKDRMSKKAVAFIDYHMRKDYEWLLKHKVNMSKKHISYIMYHYLYTRSLFTHIPIAKSDKKAFDYWRGQAEKYWVTERPYMKGLAAIALHRFDKKSVAKAIIASLREMAIYNEELGMYWKENMGGYYWYQAPIETQAVLIEAFEVITKDVKTVDKMKQWLLKMKQVQNWKTTKATVDAIYALLMGGSDWLKNDKDAQIYLGGKLVEPQKMGVKTEAGTGHFKVAWSTGEIKPKMGKITVVNPNSNPAWGALYWQYFEQLDKITPHETPLKLEKKIFREKQTDRGAVLEEVTEKMVLTPGDKLKVRIVLRVDRDMEFIHMKDMRAAGTEPINVISTHKYQDGLYYYESTKDAATNFFIERLNKGTFVFEYPLRVNLKGNFSAGITTIQCMYAPEFTSHSEGIRIEIR